MAPEHVVVDVVLVDVVENLLPGSSLFHHGRQWKVEVGGVRHGVIEYRLAFRFALFVYVAEFHAHVRFGLVRHSRVDDEQRRDVGLRKPFAGERQRLEREFRPVEWNQNARHTAGFDGNRVKPPHGRWRVFIY